MIEGPSREALQLVEVAPARQRIEAACRQRVVDGGGAR
jgi:hypothetical protein